MDEMINKGRPHGGTCWLINNEIDVLLNEILCDCINVVKISINGYIINLIGVYLIFNNNTLVNQSIYESQLSTISNLVETYKSKKEDFILVGDLNGDIMRNSNKFDKTLSKFLVNNNLKYILDTSKLRGCFSYSNNLCNSLIDYIIVGIESPLKYSNCFIDYNINNTSDHN